MKKATGKISRRITEKAQEYRNWVFENWLLYTFLKYVPFMLLPPLSVLIAEIGAGVKWVSNLQYVPVIVALVFGCLFIFLDSKRISVAEKKPADFIKAEKVEKIFGILIFALLPLSLTLFFIFSNGKRIGIAKEIIPSLQTIGSVLLLVWIGLLAKSELDITEGFYPSFASFADRVLFSEKERHVDKFYPTENIRASARFAVLSKFLSSNPDKKAIGKEFPLFYQGIKIYNDHLKDDFSFALREPKRFYCQARLAAYSKDNVDDVKKGLESLTELMKDEDREPFEIIKSLKDMLNEPSSFKEICAEIDADPHRIRKWFSVHSESIIGIVGIILAIVELSLFFLIFH